MALTHKLTALFAAGVLAAFAAGAASAAGMPSKINGPHAKLTPNPHFSHRGEEDCTNCHSLHGKSRLECNDCHSFNLNFKW